METSEVKIILIDDDEEQYTIVRKYLKRFRSGRYKIEWAPTFESAMEAIKSSPFDLCLLDYDLGERTGLELLDEMRSYGAKFPVVFLTGRGSFDMDVDAMGKGVSDFIEKNDMTAVMLERSIRYAIENHRIRSELKNMNEVLEERVRERTAELNRSNRELEQFANMVAHDLQEPLCALNALIKRTEASHDETEGGDGHTAHRLLDPVLHATRNLELLVQSVLDYSRSESESKRFELVDLTDVLKEVCDDLDEKINQVGAEIEAGPLPKIMGDRKQLRGVFENLLDNALRLRGDQRPKIQVTAKQQENQWLFSVRDNGIGIEEEDMDEIFLLFARGEGDSEQQSVGIGLAICRKIVLYHGGKIWVDSEPGEGSTFYFTLPAE